MNVDLSGCVYGVESDEVSIAIETDNSGPYYGNALLALGDAGRWVGFTQREQVDGLICWSVFATGIVLAMCFSL